MTAAVCSVIFPIRLWKLSRGSCKSRCSAFWEITTIRTRYRAADGKSVTVNDVTIAGFGGSHRYKNGDYPMLTQKESIDVAALCPHGDILISHDTAYHAMKRLDNAHCGLKGISRYISKHKPRLSVFGHYHENKLLKYKGSDLICVYRCAIISFPEKIIEWIF